MTMVYEPDQDVTGVSKPESRRSSRDSSRELPTLDSTKEHAMATTHDIDLHQFLFGGLLGAAVGGGRRLREVAHRITPECASNDRLTEASPDLLRSLLSTFIEALMGAEADTLCGAGYGERSEDRTNSRNGYRHRDFDTRAGTLDIAIPKLRQGSYFPAWLLQRRKRAERALTSVVAPATCSAPPPAGWRNSSIPSESPRCRSRRSA